MQLSQPGALFYSAILVGITARASEATVTGHFEVSDASGTVHVGLAADGQTPQQYLDVVLDPANLPEVHALVQRAIQDLVVAEYGGNVSAVIAAVISQRLVWRVG